MGDDARDGHDESAFEAYQRRDVSAQRYSMPSASLCSTAS